MKDLAPSPINKFVGGVTFLFQPSKAGGYLDLGLIPEHALRWNVDRGTSKSARDGTFRTHETYLRGIEASIRVVSPDLTKTAFAFANHTTPTAGTQTSATVTNESVTIYHDRWVKLANRKVSSVVITDGASPTPHTYVENTDYEVDYDLGAIRALSTGAIPATSGEPAAATVVKAAYSAAALTSLVAGNLFAALKVTGNGILKGKSNNGETLLYHLPNLEAKPDGDFSIGEQDPTRVAWIFELIKDLTQTTGKEWGYWEEVSAATAGS